MIRHRTFGLRRRRHMIGLQIETETDHDGVVGLFHVGGVFGQIAEVRILHHHEVIVGIDLPAIGELIGDLRNQLSGEDVVIG